MTAAAYPDLAGKTAIVTGAGRRAGLGEAMARRLALEGVRVVVSDLGVPTGPHLHVGAIGSTEEMQAVVDSIRAAGGEATAVACNRLDGAPGRGVAAARTTDISIKSFPCHIA